MLGGRGAGLDAEADAVLGVPIADRRLGELCRVGGRVDGEFGGGLVAEHAEEAVQEPVLGKAKCLQVVGADSLAEGAHDDGRLRRSDGVPEFAQHDHVFVGAAGVAVQGDEDVLESPALQSGGGLHDVVTVVDLQLCVQVSAERQTTAPDRASQDSTLSGVAAVSTMASAWVAIQRVSGTRCSTRPRPSG
ncbi:hypothetical protein [Streptomyces sp. NPDC000618]|uniref:hypothetical protein n=1 Tax=Streptomyces sp. NPDC000618 TaxID=3154265 RepID=UPI003317BA15